MLFIGDVHGKYPQYKKLIKGVKDTIQVGDMGVGFRKWPLGESSQNPPFDAMIEGNHRFIRGNHDNPEVCSRHKQWIPDGMFANPGMFCVGGAVSIDRVYRTEGYSWWPNEELSTEELNDIVDRYILTKPEIMVTHDCPEELASHMVGIGGNGTKLDPRFSSRSRQAFQAMWSAHSPRLWVYGHWHHSFDHIIRNTRFVCLAELEMRDLE